MTTDRTQALTGAGTGAVAPVPAPAGVGETVVLDVDEVGGRVERTELPGVLAEPRSPEGEPETRGPAA